MYRKSGFKLGSMRHRITVQAEVVQKDDAGQPVVSFVDWLKNEPAAYEDASGGETTRGKHVEAGVTTVFTVRYRPGYTRQHVILFDGQMYGIVDIKRIAGTDVYRELQCKSVVG